MATLDRVISVEPGKHAVAVRNVPSTLDVFTTHFERRPVLPGVLILDDIIAVAALALDGRWVLDWAEKVRFRHFVEPGHAMQIRVDVVSVYGDSAICSASVSVGERVVSTIRELGLRRVIGGEDE